MKKAVVTTLAVPLLLTLPGGGQMRADSPQQQAGQGPRIDAPRPAFLGFDVGEERRYVLGPPEALSEGELASWSIRLAELLGDPPEGIFALHHEWHAPASSFVPYPRGAVTEVESEAEARINVHGFPTEVSLRARRHLWGAGDDNYRVSYSLRDGKLLKRARAQSKDWELSIHIPGHRYLDRSVPAGLFLFLPDCFRGRPGAAASPPGGAPGGLRLPGAGVALTPPTGEIAPDLLSCRGVETIFLNPGLLSLAVPNLWETPSAERDFLFFTPLGLLVVPGGSVAMRSAPGGGRPAASGRAGRASGDPIAARDSSRYFETARLKALDRRRVRVGPRVVEAWVVEISGDLERLYIDDGGRVLRADLAAGLGQSEDAHIRLLHPSEF